MKNLINLKSYFYLIIAIIISWFLWDFIKLPYDETNIVQGTSFNKKINPYDNTAKVLFFLFFPLLTFLFIFLKKKKIYSINPLKKNFFLNQANYDSDVSDVNQLEKSHHHLSYVTLLLIVLCILEFASLDFSVLLNPIDIYHDGLILLPPINLEYYGNLWSSIHFDYGVGGNLRPLLIWKLLNIETIGSARFLDQSIVFLIKILIILICKKITLILTKNNLTQIIFFLFLSLSSVQLSNYFVSLTGTGGSEFPLRLSLFLLFYLTLINNIYSRYTLSSVVLGSFSSLSFLWYTDIAFYINGILIVYLLILIFSGYLKQIFSIIFGIFFSWIAFISIFGISETSLMFYQIRSNLDFIYYFNFLEFPKPFSDHYASSRALKSLVLIIINGVICINLCLRKNTLKFKGKLLIFITFICSLIIFKSALIRSDAYHLKYTLGYILLCFFIQVYYLLLVETNKFSIFTKKINLGKKIYINTILIIISVLFIFSKNISTYKIYNNVNENIRVVLTKNDNYFLNFKPKMYNYGRVYNEKNINDDREFILYYKKLISGDNCIQNFTEYLALGYFIKKPTCTSFYNPQFIQHNNTDKKFLNEFKKNLPNYILFKSPVIFLDKSGYQQQKSLLDGIPNVERFIEKKYSFHEYYLNNWVIYKKN